MNGKKLLESLCYIKAPGPRPSFSILHILKALEVIASEGFVGRVRLSRELKLGEGATRTLIDRLKEAGLIKCDKPGCTLTSKGREVWNFLSSKFAVKIDFGESELTVGKWNVAILVRGSYGRVENGMKQRDAAIKAGAKGATTLIFKNGRLLIPNISEDVSKDYPKAFKHIMDALKPMEGDVVVIGSADEKEAAEYGALAAAWTLL